MSNLNLDIKFEKELEDYIKNYEIILDIYALLDSDLSQFLAKSSQYFSLYNKKISVFEGDVKKIVSLRNGKFLQAEITLKILQNFSSHFKLVNPNKNSFKKTLLISQDFVTYEKFNDILVMRINKFGFLSKFNKDDISKTKKLKNILNFYFKDRSYKEILEYTKPKQTPKKGDFVFTKNKKIVLTEFVSAGGEGEIYKTNTNLVAKIYKLEKNTKDKFDKLKKMLSLNLNYNGICFAKELLFNDKKEFVGFLMPKASGIELQKGIFLKPLLKKYFPDFNRSHLVELCITILKKIKYIHSKEILIGDINPFNILIKSPSEVYFVDCDSYQIDNFPCSVGTVNFTAPEIQGVNFANFLRNQNHENFAVATLLFMIMLPGKPPYSHKDGSNPAQNIKKMHFSYALGAKNSENAPVGIWRFMWSHMPFKIKKAFYETFNENSVLNDKRLDANEWLKIFYNYKFLFDSKRLIEQDEMSLEIYPTRLKKL